MTQDQILEGGILLAGLFLSGRGRCMVEKGILPPGNSSPLWLLVTPHNGQEFPRKRGEPSQSIHKFIRCSGTKNGTQAGEGNWVGGNLGSVQLCHRVPPRLGPHIAVLKPNRALLSTLTPWNQMTMCPPHKMCHLLKSCSMWNLPTTSWMRSRSVSVKSKYLNLRWQIVLFASSHLISRHMGIRSRDSHPSVYVGRNSGPG